MTDQLNIDQLHTCPACGGVGRKPNRETGSDEICKPCEGTGSVPYDPEDKSFGY